MKGLKKLCFGLFLVFSVIFCVSFVNSSDASAVSYFSGNYSARVNVYYYDASMPSERGYRAWTPISNGPVPSSTPSNEGLLIPATGANYYIYAKGITLTGLTISGGDSSKRYQSAEADAYFYMPDGPTTGDFDDVDLSCTYYTQSGNYVTISGDWSFSEVIHPTASYVAILDCPVVNNSNYDPYVSVDFTLGDFIQNNPQTPPSYYFYRYVNGGGVWFSGGSYQVSSSDNEELNAIENQTYVLEKGFSDVIDAINQQNNQEAQDREDFQDESDNASDTSDDLSDDVTNASSSLLVIIGNFVNIVLNPPQSDCNITLDVGNANFGQADLCRLSLPQPLAVLGTLFILGFIITFSVSLIMTFLSLLKGATQG